MIWLLVAFIVGLIFQSVLPGSIRMVLIYPLAILLGFLTHIDILFLMFGLGMTSRAIIGGYWACVSLELSCLLMGIAIGFFI